MNWPELEPNEYLEIDGPGAVRVRGTRVDLCVLVEDYLDGHLPEQMATDYPTLELEAVFGVLAYYLGHRESVDAYVALCRERANRQREACDRKPAAPIVERLRKRKYGSEAA